MCKSCQNLTAYKYIPRLTADSEKYILLPAIRFSKECYKTKYETILFKRKSGTLLTFDHYKILTLDLFANNSWLKNHKWVKL